MIRVDWWLVVGGRLIALAYVEYMSSTSSLLMDVVMAAPLSFLLDQMEDKNMSKIRVISTLCYDAPQIIKLNIF